MTSNLPVKPVLWALTVIALALRVVAVFYIQSYDVVAGMDPGAMEHGPIAGSMLAGFGYSFGDFGYYGPSSVQSPTYPYLLLALFWLFGAESNLDAGAGHAYLAVMLMQALLGAVTVPLVYLLAKQLGSTALVGLLAGRGVRGLADAGLHRDPCPGGSCSLSPASPRCSCSGTASIEANGKLFALDRVQRDLLLRRAHRAGAAPADGAQRADDPRLVDAELVRPLPQRGGAVRDRVCDPAALDRAELHGAWQVHAGEKSTFWVNVWKGNNPYATGTDRLVLTEAQKRELERAGMIDAVELARDPPTSMIVGSTRC